VVIRKKKIYSNNFLDFFSRSKDGIVLSVNEDISSDRQKFEIIGKYDLIVKTVMNQDSGRYLCQNFEQGLSINIQLTVLSKYLILIIPRSRCEDY
jgi:hypothetical protein